MNKKVLFLAVMVLAVMNFQAAKAETKKTKKKTSHFITGFGWGCMSEWGKLASYASYSINSTDTTYEKRAQPVSAGLFHMGLNSHYLLKEFNKEHSLSISAFPTLGFSIVKSRIFDLTVPLFINYNIGNVSTYNSKKDMGFTAGIGVEWIHTGFVNLGGQDDAFADYKEYGFYKKTLNIIQPCIDLGLRYFTRGGNAQELNLKFGMKSAKPLDIMNAMPSTDAGATTSFWVRLSLVHYIGY